MTAKELKLDYFKFYDVEDRGAEGDLVLQGQFDGEKGRKMSLRLLDFFANPVSKNREPMLDKNAHLSWYRGLHPADPTRWVALDNQFGHFELHIGRARGLLVPTLKVEERSAFPEGLGHYKVYQVLDGREAPGKPVELKDQFTGEEVRLGPPLFFAVPVTKQVGKKTFPIYNKDAHLLFFPFRGRDIGKTIKLKNQFAPRGVSARVIRGVMLAAPSIKAAWKPV